MKFIVNNKVVPNRNIFWRFTGHKAMFSSHPDHFRNNVETFRRQLKLSAEHTVDIINGDVTDLPSTIIVRSSVSKKAEQFLIDNNVTYTTTEYGAEPTRHGEEKIEEDATTTTTTNTPFEYSDVIGDSKPVKKPSVPNNTKNPKHNTKHKLRKKAL